MKRFTCAAAVVLFFLTGTVFARQSAQAKSPVGVPDGKIAVVNPETFPEKVAELKQKYDQIDTQFKPRLEKIKEMADRLKKLEGELRSNANTMPADKLRQLQTEYEDLQRKGTREETDLHEEVNRALEALTRPVNEKLAKFIGVYAAQRNIVAVFNLASAAESGLLAFWNPGTDITDDFIAEYNKVNPVSGAPPAPPKQP